MNARELEAQMLTRCVAAARGRTLSAQSGAEANVLRLAGMVIQSRFPAEAARLGQASQRYFAQHPADLLEPADVLRRGWLVSLPRLRDLLSLQLRTALQTSLGQPHVG